MGMSARQRYAILEHLLTSPSSGPPTNNNNGPATKPPLVRYASFSSLLDLASDPLPKLSPREVDDVLGPNSATLNVSLESIPPLFTPNNQCSDFAPPPHPPPPPGPPKRSCSAPAAHLSSPFPPPAVHDPPPVAWRIAATPNGAAKVNGRRPLAKSLITTSADVLASFEPAEGGRPVGVAVARSGSLQEVADLGEELRKTSILRLFPSLQSQAQSSPRLLLAAASTKPRPMAVVTPGRGIHVDPLLCRLPGCEKLFRSAAARNQHYWDEHANETFPCPQCPIRLLTKTALDIHRRKKHQEFVRQSRECPVEGCVRKFYVDSRLLHHLRVHHRQRCLPCIHAECDAKFLNSRERDKHLRSEHSGLTPLTCADCRREFPSRLLMQRHRRRVHRPAKPEPELSATLTVDCATNTGAGSVSVATNTAKVPPCTICEAVFPTWEQLAAHLAAHARLATDMVEQQRQRASRTSRKPTAEVAVGTDEREGQVLIACPVPDCNILCEDHRTFREHFSKHFGNEMGHDQAAALLPTDFFPPPPPLTALPAFETPMEDSTCLTSFNDAETSSLFQALDLNLLSAITEVDDTGLLDQMLAPDLASALTLPNAHDPRTRAPRMPALAPAPCLAAPDDAELNPGPDDAPSSARTCPRLNQQMAELAKRRKALLLERVTLGFEPRPAHPGSHLKDVMRQIFHSKALPSKYQAPAMGDEPEVNVSDPGDSAKAGPGESEALLAPLAEWMLPGDILTQTSAETPLDPPMLDQLL